MPKPTIPVTTRIASPLGPLLLASTDSGLAGVWFEGQRHQPDASAWPVSKQHPLLLQAQEALANYFAGAGLQHELALDLSRGTLFHQTVWRALLQIPYGSSSSYGALSARIGKPTAQRAVGAAVGRNPLGIFIPCHRVLGADGALTGYAGGLDRKIALLKLEACSFKAPAQPQEFLL